MTEANSAPRQPKNPHLRPDNPPQYLLGKKNTIVTVKTPIPTFYHGIKLVLDSISVSEVGADRTPGYGGGDVLISVGAVSPDQEENEVSQEPPQTGDTKTPKIPITKKFGGFKQHYIVRTRRV